MVQSEAASGLCKWHSISLRASSIMDRDAGCWRGCGMLEGLRPPLRARSLGCGHSPCSKQPELP